MTGRSNTRTGNEGPDALSLQDKPAAIATRPAARNAIRRRVGTEGNVRPKRPIGKRPAPPFRVICVTGRFDYPGRPSEIVTMAKESAIEMEGTVSEVLPNATFRVTMENGHDVLATMAGKMRQFRIRVAQGDRVTIEVSPYDLTRGRITFRHKN